MRTTSVILSLQVDPALTPLAFKVATVPIMVRAGCECTHCAYNVKLMCYVERMWKTDAKAERTNKGCDNGSDNENAIRLITLAVQGGFAMVNFFLDFDISIK